ncbi:MAG: Tol-Pal system beta propeller repeat protein TolB [Deltaproteobacteria bacterium]|nr:Tol-Pal system beta propeller repeat protein TolB [Deltaproteobacteria bacterium]
MVGRRARWVIGIVIALGTLGAAGEAGAQVRGTIVGPGATSFPIAVSPLKSTSGAEREAGTFADIVAKDLDLSGLFRVIDRAAYIENSQQSGVTAETIDFRDWSTVGAQALVKGTVERDGDGLVVEARLFDVVEGKQIGGKRYRAGDDELRRVSHRFADEVMQILTGERGPFESRIAFASRRKGRFKEIYAMSIDAGDLRAVTRDGSIALAPSWSPDGRSLLFTSFVSGNPSLFVADLGGDKRLVSSRHGLNLGGRWSPGGRAIAVALENGGATDIALLDPDGQIMHFVTKDRSIDVSPSWSPDGQSIVFCSDRGGGPQIYVVSAQGGTPRRVTFEGSYNTSPAWSPKGDRIAYASRLGGRFQVFTVALGGGDVKRITSTRGDNEDPSWSPDGRYLIFSSTRDGSGAIYLSDAAGTRQTRLTPPGGDDSSPAWSRWLE